MQCLGLSCKGQSSMKTLSEDVSSPLRGQCIFIFIMTDINVTNLQCIFIFIITGLSVTDLFDLSYRLNTAMKQKDLVNHIESLKGKVIVYVTIKKLSNEICQLSASVIEHMTGNGKISFQLMVVSNANTLFVTRVTELQ